MVYYSWSDLRLRKVFEFGVCEEKKVKIKVLNTAMHRVFKDLNCAFPRTRFGTGSMKLMKAELLPSNVVMLQMARPRDWMYNAGDYIFIKIKDISLTKRVEEKMTN